jgi:Ser/Thr protein kinase RdoA (MazF antagonist)
VTRRSSVLLGRGHVTKVFATEHAADREAEWYARFPWACPRLLSRDGATLVTERLPLAPRYRDRRNARALKELLEELHKAGVHHRDVHLGNVVLGPKGPLLIDWETAIEQPAPVSYDLYGPEASGVPLPEIHSGLTPQWWGSGHRLSIGKRWGNA